MIVSGAFGLIGIEDGIGYEDIYTLTTGGTAPSKPASENVNDYVPSGWYASPQSVTSTKRYQWVCKRSKKNGTWSAWSTPVEYNRYVEDGKDGDDGVGYEYCYKATQYNVRPDIPISEATGVGIPTGWSSSAPDISAINAYIWESYRTVWGNSRTNWKTPKLKNRWSSNGAQGSKGAKMRMRTWESSENYMQGAEGEDFYDIVVYGTQLYLCIKSHYSSASNAPNVSTTYWESAQQWTFIATQLLIAGKIVTDKITADLIDADGLVVNNATVKGNIYTPMTVITEDNWRDYLDIKNIGEGNSVAFINWIKTGLNVQINYWPDLLTSYLSITCNILEFPVGIDFLGCEANIFFTIERNGKTSLGLPYMYYDSNRKVWIKASNGFLGIGFYKLRVVDMLGLWGSDEEDRYQWTMQSFQPIADIQ